MVAPVVILSLQRSGSTLLQRILASHTKIASTAEPWTLLPFAYALRDHGISAEYNQLALAKAHNDFILGLPKGYSDYCNEVQQFVLALYTKATTKPGAIYFVDKSPGYSFIADNLPDLLHCAKYIFLWRNPLAIASSWVQAYDGGRWRVAHLHREFAQGLPKLLDCYRRISSRAIAVRYEDLVTHPEREISRITQYLGIPFEKNMLVDFAKVEFSGEMGDPSRHRYKTISPHALNEWQNVYCNFLRKSWGRRLLRGVGDADLKLMGYDQETIKLTLDSSPGISQSLFGDLLQSLSDAGKLWLATQVWDGRLPY